VDRSLAPGTPIPVKADLRWAACTATQCVPLRATLTLDLVAGDGTADPRRAALHAAARKLPRRASGATFAVDGGRIALHLPPSLRIDPGAARFFPDEGSIMDVATEKGSTDGDAPTIVAALEGKPPQAFGGVLSDGRNAFRLRFAPASATAQALEPEPTVVPEAVTPAPRQPTLQASPAAEPPSVPTSHEADNPVNETWLWLVLAAIVATGAGFVWAIRRNRGGDA
jgi:hypothetical protein